MLLRPFPAKCFTHPARFQTCLGVPRCSAASTASSPKIVPFSPAEEDDAARIAMKFAVSQYRPNMLRRLVATFNNLWSMTKYRLLEDRRFRMRQFRRASRSVISLIAAKSLQQDYEGLKELMTPEAISKVKNEFKTASINKRVLANLVIYHDNLILREKIFNAAFSNIALTDGRTKRAFEVTFLYLCRMKQDALDRTKVTTLLKGNQFGGRDEVRGTLPMDAYVFASVWMTLAKSLEKGSDWRVIRYEPLPAFITRKQMEKYL